MKDRGGHSDGATLLNPVESHVAIGLRGQTMTTCW